MSSISTADKEKRSSGSRKAERVEWTRFSCHDFIDNQVRLRLFVLAYNPKDILWQAKPPRAIRSKRASSSGRPTMSSSTAPENRRSSPGRSLLLRHAKLPTVTSVEENTTST